MDRRSDAIERPKISLCLPRRLNRTLVLMRISDLFAGCRLMAVLDSRRLVNLSVSLSWTGRLRKADLRNHQQHRHLAQDLIRQDSGYHVTVGYARTAALASPCPARMLGGPEA